MDVGRYSFLNPSKKKFRVFDWGLRDIDGATHFQGIAMQQCNCKSFFQYIFVKKC